MPPLLVIPGTSMAMAASDPMPPVPPIGEVDSPAVPPLPPLPPRASTVVLLELQAAMAVTKSAKSPEVEVEAVELGPGTHDTRHELNMSVSS
jgi:hypothetical protein